MDTLAVALPAVAMPQIEGLGAISTAAALCPPAAASNSAAGDVEVEAQDASDDEDDGMLPPSLAMVPSMVVAPTFLDKNSQSHMSAMTAFGDIIDNSRECHATELTIDWRMSTRGAGGRLLVFSDNGVGMTEAQMRDGLMSIGFSNKSLATGLHYGFGAKTALPRLAEYALIFTRERRNGHRTVGLLSAAFSQSNQAKETKMPLCSWQSDTNEFVPHATGTAPLTGLQRRASSHFLLACESLPYGSMDELLGEFERGAFAQGAGTGTRIVLWSLHRDLSFRQDGRTKRHDIVVKAVGLTSGSALPHHTSLCAYAEVLYLRYGGQTVPSLRIRVQGDDIVYRDWQRYLGHHTREQSLPKPAAVEVQRQFIGGASADRKAALECARRAEATLVLGQTRSMAELCAAQGPIQRLCRPTPSCARAPNHEGHTALLARSSHL